MAIPTIDPQGDAPWSRIRRIGHYGGATDKENDKDEALFSYAYVWYLELQNMRGSAYNRDRRGLVHAENLALARSFMAVSRASDRLQFNSQPHTSDEKLGAWTKTLKVQIFEGDTKHDIRQRCAAKYRAVRGPTQSNEDETIEALLGEAFVKVHRTTGVDLATEPALTFWPGVNPGPAAYSLGNGAWLSERANLVIEVKRPDALPLADYLRLLGTDLFLLLDRMLPAWATFNWAENVSNGFRLDFDQLDFGGMGS